MLPSSSKNQAVVASHSSTVLTNISLKYVFQKKISLLTIITLCGLFGSAQKVVPVSTSPLTGITLPQGSRQDKRLLSAAAANALMSDAAKNNNVVLKSAEVLYLPLNFTSDSLKAAALNAGWKISADDSFKNFSWLQQGNKYVLLYYSTTKKENNIYFAESNKAPTVQNNSVAQTNNNGSGLNNNSQPQQTTTPQINTVTPAVHAGFAFSTTNFDDGWTATEKSDWVEVTKANIKVLLHYPKEGTVFPADPEPLTNAAWNILVAPRYSNLKNYRTAYITTYNRPYLGMGYATEISSGKEMFVLLFRQGGIWMEFITPDKNAFIQQYKFDPETIRWDSDDNVLKPLLTMSGYNKFAVAASDFGGKWTSDFNGIQQLYHVYTGNYAGMNINQSREEFIFGDGGAYNWRLLVVNGMVGNMNYNQVKSAGRLTVTNNWQVQCTKIENGPKTYHAFWSCIKGARILNLLDANYPGSGIYTQYGLAK